MVHRTPFFLPMLYPSLVWRMPSYGRTLYLTFDDGPVPGPTEFVLETLSKLNSKATFFCIGENVRKHPGIFDTIYRNGHTVGNHTFNHVNGWKTSTDDYERNVELCSKEIAEHAGTYGVKDVLLRPPFGRMTRSQIKRLTPKYKVIMWDVLSIDYNHRLQKERCLDRTIAAARPGSIIVFHDSYKAEKNLRFALPRFIEHYLEKGYTFKEL
jgi:peptidoglycan/xylan/chitin deacetylase (PgdA/CDA1 family)